MMAEELKKITGSCNGCIFATYDDIIQNGCELGKLEKFQEQSRASMTPEGYYALDGICRSCRGEAWGHANIGTNLIAAVERETRINMDIVLYSIDDDVDMLDKPLLRAIKNCIDQKVIKPRSIVVVVKNANVDSWIKLYRNLQDLTHEHDILFNLVRVMEDEADINRCLELGIEKCNSQYVATFDLHNAISSNFICRFHNVVNEDLRRVLMVEPQRDYHGMIIVNKIFEILGGNYYLPIYEKIKQEVAAENKPELVLQWTDL